MLFLEKIIYRIFVFGNFLCADVKELDRMRLVDVLSHVFLNLLREECFQLTKDFPPVCYGLVPFSGNVPGGQIEHFFQGCSRVEHLACFRGFTYLTVEPFNGIGGVYNLAQIWGVLEVGREVAPVVSPTSHADRIGLSPFRFELG
jgi:hypothetical protein